MVTGLGFPLSPVVQAVADPIASCSTTTGVIVAVDFSHVGGNVERGCASTPTTGYQALQNAGFASAGDEHDPSAAPTATPVAPPKGAPAAPLGSHGTTTAAPAVARDAAPATSATSSTAPGRSTTIMSGETTIAPATGRGAAGSPTSAGNERGTPSVNRAAPRIVDVAPASARPHGSSGSPLPFSIGGLVVVVLAAGGGFVAWRRRSAGA
jgi:hypothetical protein